MNADAFKLAYEASRNGTDGFTRYPMVRGFQYSDGVRECAEAGCYWLLDILATECPKPLQASGAVQGIIKVDVAGSRAKLSMTTADDAPPVWQRRIGFTSLPSGTWTFMLADEGERFALILVTEY